MLCMISWWGKQKKHKRHSRRHSELDVEESQRSSRRSHGNLGAEPLDKDTLESVQEKIWEACCTTTGVDIHHLFESLDKDCDNSLSFKEFRKGIRQQGVTDDVASDLILKQVFVSLDTDHDEKVSISDLVAFCGSSPKFGNVGSPSGATRLNKEEVAFVKRTILAASASESALDLAKLFWQMDKDRSGQLTNDELQIGIRTVLKVSQDDLADRHIVSLFHMMDPNSDNKINIHDLVAFMGAEEISTDQENVAEQISPIAKMFKRMSDEEIEIVRSELKAGIYQTGEIDHRKLFESIAKDNTGKIDVHVLKDALRTKLRIDHSVIDRVADCKGTVDIKEFVDFICKGVVVPTHSREEAQQIRQPTIVNNAIALDTNSDALPQQDVEEQRRVQDGESDTPRSTAVMDGSLKPEDAVMDDSLKPKDVVMDDTLKRKGAVMDEPLKRKDRLDAGSEEPELSLEMLGMVRSKIKMASYHAATRGEDIPYLFRRMDKKNDGFLGVAEFRKALRVQMKMPKEIITDSQIQKLATVIDKTGNGRVNVEDLTAFIKLEPEQFAFQQKAEQFERVESLRTEKRKDRSDRNVDKPPICSNCSKVYVDGAKFCSECGQPREDLALKLGSQPGTGDTLASSFAGKVSRTPADRSNDTAFSRIASADIGGGRTGLGGDSQAGKKSRTGANDASEPDLLAVPDTPRPLFSTSKSGPEVRRWDRFPNNGHSPRGDHSQGCGEREESSRSGSRERRAAFASVVVDEAMTKSKEQNDVAQLESLRAKLLEVLPSVEEQRRTLLEQFGSDQGGLTVAQFADMIRWQKGSHTRNNGLGDDTWVTQLFVSLGKDPLDEELPIADILRFGLEAGRNKSTPRADMKSRRLKKMQEEKTEGLTEQGLSHQKREEEEEQELLRWKPVPYQAAPNKIFVTIYNCAGVKNCWSANVFCHIQVVERPWVKCKTRVARTTEIPTWNSDHHLEPVEDEDVLQFTIFDKKATATAGACLGVGFLEASDFKDSTFDGTLDLESATLGEKCEAKLKVKVRRMQEWLREEGAVAPGARLGPKHTVFSRLYKDFLERQEMTTQRDKEIEDDDTDSVKEMKLELGSKPATKFAPGTYVEEISDRLYDDAEKKKHRLEKLKDETYRMEAEMFTLPRKFESREDEPRWETLYETAFDTQHKIEVMREQKVQAELQYMADNSVHPVCESAEPDPEIFDRLYVDNYRRLEERENRRADLRSQLTAPLWAGDESDRADIIMHCTQRLYDTARKYRERVDVERSRAEKHAELRMAFGRSSTMGPKIVVGPSRYQLLYDDARRRDYNKKLAEYNKSRVERCLDRTGQAQDRPVAKERMSDTQKVWSHTPADDVFDRMYRPPPRHRSLSMDVGAFQEGSHDYEKEVRQALKSYASQTKPASLSKPARAILVRDFFRASDPSGNGLLSEPDMMGIARRLEYTPHHGQPFGQEYTALCLKRGWRPDRGLSLACFSELLEDDAEDNMFRCSDSTLLGAMTSVCQEKAEKGLEGGGRSLRRGSTLGMSSSVPNLRGAQESQPRARRVSTARGTIIETPRPIPTRRATVTGRLESQEDASSSFASIDSINTLASSSSLKTSKPHAIGGPNPAGVAFGRRDNEPIRKVLSRASLPHEPSVDAIRAASAQKPNKRAETSSPPRRDSKEDFAIRDQRRNKWAQRPKQLANSSYPPGQNGVQVKFRPSG